MFNQSQKIGLTETTPVSIDTKRDTIGSLTEKIRAGEALLRVVAYPWGVEFDVYEIPVASGLEASFV